MVNRKVKKKLETKKRELCMNLENNYKDLARDALKEYASAVEELYQQGELKEKDYIRYKSDVETYKERMKGYHH